MEALPEGVNLEARGREEKGKSKEVQLQDNTESARQPQSATTDHGAQQVPQRSQSTHSQHPSAKSEPRQPHPAVSSTQSSLQPPPPSYTHAQRSVSPIPHTHTPTPESAQSHAESYLSSSELTTQSRQRRPMMSVHAPPVAAASAAVNDPAPLADTTATPAGTARGAPYTNHRPRNSVRLLDAHPDGSQEDRLPCWPYEFGWCEIRRWGSGWWVLHGEGGVVPTITTSAREPRLPLPLDDRYPYTSELLR